MKLLFDTMRRVQSCLSTAPSLLNRKRNGPFTLKEFSVIIAIGIITPIIDHRILDFFVQFFYNLQGTIRIFAYTGGPVDDDLLLSWLEYGGVLAVNVVRKPGSATLAMTVNGFVQVFVNGSHLPHLLYGFNGLAADSIFFSFRYKRYDILSVSLAGIASSLAWFVNVGFSHDEFMFPVLDILRKACIRVIGGMIGDGWLGGALGFLLMKLHQKVGPRLHLEVRPPTDNP